MQVKIGLLTWLSVDTTCSQSAEAGEAVAIRTAYTYVSIYLYVSLYLYLYLSVYTYISIYICIYLTWLSVDMTCSQSADAGDAVAIKTSFPAPSSGARSTHMYVSGSP